MDSAVPDAEIRSMLLCMGVATGCSHAAVVTGGRHPNDLPEFRWINILLSNLKTSFSGTFHAFDYRYAGLRLRQICQALSGRLLLPLQQALQDG
jgi:hypothetical protein